MKVYVALCPKCSRKAKLAKETDTEAEMKLRQYKLDEEVMMLGCGHVAVSEMVDGLDSFRAPTLGG